MTRHEALAEGRNMLPLHVTDTPELDASLLLAHACSTDRARLYMELKEEMRESEHLSYRQMLNRRREGEPAAWITGLKEFWGLNFHIGPGVFCPRPDSEIVVETALDFMPPSSEGRLHDCCCGPGTLAAPLAVERPSWRIFASDISEIAGEYCRRNNRSLCGGRICFTQTHLLDGIEGPFDVIVANPPYLTGNEVDRGLRLGWKEPDIALDGGGEDGLNLIRGLIPQAAERLRLNGVLILEADPSQMAVIRQILSENDFRSIAIRQDLGGRDRVIYGSKRP
ncbi:MAG: protein-(glutamine-N5) methyltransferase, release factor-specific [spirochete symbiont of Stewartia floridana]|nr:MAG: protein-(glutamine-N5) methyltransferase, release factor-specific [spirochete symbiont of Stewartia floridana]